MWTRRMHVLRAAIQRLWDARALAFSVAPVHSPSIAAPQKRFGLKALRRLVHRPLYRLIHRHNGHPLCPRTWWLLGLGIHEMSHL